MDSTQAPRERSRNARAQARHRAKRKAYVEQLEQTVTALQLRLGIPMEDLGTMTPPSARIHDLEIENNQLKNENIRLKRENDELRRLANIPPHPRPQIEYHHNSSPGFHTQPDQHRRLPSLNEDHSYTYSNDHDSYHAQRPHLHPPASSSHYSSLSPMSNATSTSSSSAYVLTQLQIPQTHDAGNGNDPVSPSFSSSNTSTYSRSPTSYSPTTNAPYSHIKVEEGSYQTTSSQLPSLAASYAIAVPSMEPTMTSPHPSINGHWHHGYTPDQQYHH